MKQHQGVTVRATRPDDAAAARRAQYQGWRDTYVRPDALSPEQLEELWGPRLTEDGIAAFAEEIRERAGDPETVQLVAEIDGEVIGTAIALAPELGPQALRVLYVAAAARGQGVGGALMDAALARMDPARPVGLGVAAFNVAAQCFYRRFGFEEVPGSDSTCAGVIPDITMVRPAVCAQREPDGATGANAGDRPGTGAGR